MTAGAFRRRRPLAERTAGYEGYMKRRYEASRNEVTLGNLVKFG